MNDTLKRMTVADGLTELKRVDKLLEKINLDLNRYSSKKKGSKDEIENQARFVTQQFQRGNDLIVYYNKIKIAIQKSNLETIFEFEGEKYSIAEGLLLKQGIFGMLEMHYSSLNSTNAQRQIMHDQRAYNLSGANQETLEKLDFVPELMYSELEINKKREKLLNLRSYIDALIEKSNHATFVEL